MNILIVYSHPGKKSYTSQVLEKLYNELKGSNCDVVISDLYSLNFKTDMTEQEYERESSTNSEVPLTDDVKSEQAKLEWADCVIFLYPVWWSDCPAKLKGWFDRVFTVGYAYKQVDFLPRMKTIKYGLVLCTAGYSNEFLNGTGIAQSMRIIMLDDRLGKRFEIKEMVILGDTLNAEKSKQIHEEQLKQIIEKIIHYCA